MKSIEDWMKHFDDKNITEQTRTQLVDWLIKGNPIPETLHREICVLPTIHSLELNQDHHFLEIGCGSGLFLSEIEKKVKRSVGTDISKTLLESFPSQSEKILCAAHELPFPEKTFDRILMYGVVVCFPSFDYLKQVISKAMSLLRDDGIFLIGDVPFGKPSEGNYHILYDKHEIIRFLDSFECPYSIAVPHRSKRLINNRQDIIIYKDQRRSRPSHWQEIV